MPSSGEMNTFKVSTIMLMLLGIIIPFWPLSLPLFWWLAYRSYKKGEPAELSITELHAAKELLESGAISEEEYDRVKNRTRSVSGM